MNHRDRCLAVLRNQPYDRLPVVHFGYWHETLHKWASEGHISEDLAKEWRDGNVADGKIAEKLGFDCGWGACFGTNTFLLPGFEVKTIRELPDGSKHVRGWDGVTILVFPGATSIPAEIDHLLQDRESWEEHYLPRFQWDDRRVTESWVRAGPDEMLRWDQGGLETLRQGVLDIPYGIWCGSAVGQLRNILGVEGLAYLEMDDPDLMEEILETLHNLSYRAVETVLQAGAKLDYGHFWEDICFKSGPLITPTFAREKLGPYYRRTTQLLARHGIDLVSLDSDGKVDDLLPIWLEHGINVMFPVEVGTWHASIAPWREQYGPSIKAVGGMDKRVFAQSREAIEAEIERLRPLIELGGFLPCPDHRIAPDAEWDLVRYYCDRMHAVFA